VSTTLLNSDASIELAFNGVCIVVLSGLAAVGFFSSLSFLSHDLGIGAGQTKNKMHPLILFLF